MKTISVSVVLSTICGISTFIVALIQVGSTALNQVGRVRLVLGGKPKPSQSTATREQRPSPSGWTWLAFLDGQCNRALAGKGMASARTASAFIFPRLQICLISLWARNCAASFESAKIAWQPLDGVSGKRRFADVLTRPAELALQLRQQGIRGSLPHQGAPHYAVHENLDWSPETGRKVYDYYGIPPYWI